MRRRELVVDNFLCYDEGESKSNENMKPSRLDQRCDGGNSSSTLSLSKKDLNITVDDLCVKDL